jgi:hypothetical protein
MYLHHLHSMESAQAQDAHLFGHTSIQLVEALNHMAPVQHWGAILAHLMQHKVPEELQQIPVPCFPRHTHEHYVQLLPRSTFFSSTQPCTGHPAAGKGKSVTEAWESAPVSAHWGSLSLSGRSRMELKRTSTRSSRPSSAPFHTCTTGTPAISLWPMQAVVLPCRRALF